MAVAIYPDIPQCEGTARNEVTKILSDVSENGVIRGRCMHDTPTYELTMVHTAISRDLYNMFDQWWKDNLGNEIQVTWVVDGLTYKGVPEGSPSISYTDSLFDISLGLLVKESV